ncbi:MAG: hypothetical protein WCG75_03100 [Armatimonadota bacterium]
MITSLTVASLFNLSGSNEILEDLAPLGAKTAREIKFHLESGIFLGDKISQDGSMMFQTNVLRTPIISLIDGKLMWEERMRIGITSNYKSWIVGTMSQWGHMSYGPELRDAELADIESPVRWLGLGSFKKDKRQSRHEVIVADIDTKSRKLPPNRQVVFSQANTFSNAAISGFYGHFLPNGGIQCHVFSKTPSSGTSLDIWTIGKGANKAVQKSTKLAIKWTENSYATDYDPVHGRVIVKIEKPRRYLEYNIQTRTTSDIPNVPKNVGPHYWRGMMLQASGIGSSTPGYGLDIFSQDRKTVKHLGPYSWIAQSSNERFVLFKKETDETYWLVDFARPPGR